MDTMWLVLIALALGLTVGGGFVALITLALRRGERAATVVNPVVPDGVDQVLEALDSAGIVVDPSNNVLKASPGAFALGLVRDRVLDNQELIDLALEVRRTGDAVTSDLELALGRFGEATRHLRVRAAPLGSRFILLLAEDHTEARRLDEVRRDFIANISHELKTPIGAIGLLSEALDTAADDPERVKRFASRLATESHRLTRMTAEIIDLSRLQAADALHQPELVRLDRVIAAAVDQNRVPADATGVGLSVRGGKNLEVYGDEAMLVVAVHNLISNAIHYSPTGAQVGE
jgi:two-component system sensor histidine kinase SenX3